MKFLKIKRKMMKRSYKKRKIQNVNFDEEVNLQNPNKRYNRKNKSYMQKLFKFIYPFSFIRRVVIPIIFLLFILLIHKLIRKRKRSPKIAVTKKLYYFSNNSVSNTENVDAKTDDPREQALLKGASYIKKCFEEVSETSPRSISNSGIIKISVIIPVYNNEKNIKSIIRSVQRQDMNEIEIILVNDYSTDNTLNVIQEIQKNDPRISIINNDKNMGTLYSRSIGVLKANGKYILNLDHDDLFLDSDVFDTVYNEAEKNNFDIISFMFVQGTDYNININNVIDGFTTNLKDNFTVYQPDLAYYPIFKNESFAFIDNTIWGKLINTDIYKSSVNLLGEERYTVYNIINEDIISLFAVCRMARSYEYLKKYGLFHLIDKTTKPYNKKKEDIMYYDVFFSDILFDLSLNENKKYAAFIIIGIKSSWSFSILKQETKSYLMKVISKILNSEYIADKYKDKIRALYGRLEISTENGSITSRTSNNDVPNIGNTGNTPTPSYGTHTGNTPTPSNGTHTGNTPMPSYGANAGNTGNTPTSSYGTHTGNTPMPSYGANAGNTGNTPTSSYGTHTGNTPMPSYGTHTGNTPTPSYGTHTGNTPMPSYGANAGNTPTSSYGTHTRNTPTPSYEANAGNTGNTPTSSYGTNISNTGNTPYSSYRANISNTSIC